MIRLPFNGDYGVTRPYGVYDSAYANYPNSVHPGTDFGLPTKTPIVAVEDVIVSEVFDRDPNIKIGRGKEVGIKVGNREYRYCHMSYISVKADQRLKAGEMIGLSGYTGYVMDAQGRIGTPGGAHLHFEMLIDSKYVDFEKNRGKGVDMPYIEQAELDDLRSWKAVGIDAQPYKDAVIKSGIEFSDFEQLVAKLKDLDQFKKDNQNLSSSDANGKLDKIKKILLS